MKNERTKNMILCALFTALITVGTFIKIPIPVVPFTLQLEFTLLAGVLLGPKWGTVSVLVYIIMGLIGLPVFTEGGGLGYVLKPAFGYIIGFALGALAAGYIANKSEQPSLKRLLAANFTGLLIVYAVGVVYYYLICLLYLNDPIGVWKLLWYCFLLLVPKDIILCILSAVLLKRLIPIMKKI